MTCSICERHCGRASGVHRDSELIHGVCNECKIIMDLHPGSAIMFGRLI